MISTTVSLDIDLARENHERLLSKSWKNSCGLDRLSKSPSADQRTTQVSRTGRIFDCVAWDFGGGGAVGSVRVRSLKHPRAQVRLVDP